MNVEVNAVQKNSDVLYA